VRRISKHEKSPKNCLQQQARWLQCNSDESRPGEVRLYQMMVDGPARVVRPVSRQEADSTRARGGAIQSPQGIDAAGQRDATYRESPGQTPLDDRPSGDSRGAARFHTGRPRHNVGHHWERQVSASGFEGRKSSSLPIGKNREAATGRITLLVEGKFAGVLEKDFNLGKRSSNRLVAARPDVAACRAQAEYQRRRGGDRRGLSREDRGANWPKRGR